MKAIDHLVQIHFHLSLKLRPRFHYHSHCNFGLRVFSCAILRLKPLSFMNYNVMVYEVIIFFVKSNRLHNRSHTLKIQSFNDLGLGVVLIFYACKI